MDHTPRARLTTLGALVCAATLALTGLVSAPAQATGLPSEKQWHRDVAEAMAGSKAYVDRKVGNAGDARLAINFDIDNSALATHYRNGTAVSKVLSFAEHARNQGVALLFNTARRGDKLKDARTLLENAGYDVTEVCGRTKATMSLVRGKRWCRAHFIKQGYTLIGNVGNNDTDFSGAENYGRAFRLPNYGRRLT